MLWLPQVIISTDYRSSHTLQAEYLLLVSIIVFIIKLWQMADAELSRKFSNSKNNYCSFRNICRKFKQNSQQRHFAKRFPGPFGRWLSLRSGLSTRWPSDSTCLYSSIYKLRGCNKNSPKQINFLKVISFKEMIIYMIIHMIIYISPI